MTIGNQTRGLGRARVGGKRGLDSSDKVAAIDIGASKVACLIATIEEGIEGPAEIEVIGAGQHGIAPKDARKNIGATTERAVRKAVDVAERMAGERIRKALVTVHGRQLLSRRVGVDLDLDGGAVTEQDVVESIERGAAISAQDGASLVHALPIRFSLDGEDVGSNPCGMVGGLLATEMLGLGVRESHEANLGLLLEHCDIAVDQLIASPLASAEAVLIEDEKELGAIVIDIGARSADYAIYQNGCLIDCGGIGVGGDHITRDIAQIFGGSIVHAERIKTLQGASLAGPGDDHGFINFPQLGDASDVTKVSRADLSAVIAPRVEEILALVMDQCNKAVGRQISGRDGVRRAVITGGGSLLTGVRETAERICGVRTRLGRPMALSGLADVATAPQFSACIGALIYSAQQKQEPWCREGGAKFLQYDSATLKEAGLFGGVQKWLKANF